MAATRQFNVRLPDETYEQIRRLCEELHVSQVDVVRLAVRMLAKKELGERKKSDKNPGKDIDNV